MLHTLIFRLRSSSNGVHPDWAALHVTHATRRRWTAARILRSGRGDTHGSIPSVHALHLLQSFGLHVRVGKADEAVATRHASDVIGHNLGGFARWILRLEEEIMEMQLLDPGGIAEKAVENLPTATKIWSRLATHIIERI